MLFMCRKERGLSSPRTRQRSPTSVSGRLHPAGIPRCSPDWMQLQFQFPQTAVGNLTELVQSTLLQDDESGNFQKKEIGSVAFPPLQTGKICLLQMRYSHNPFETHSTLQQFHFSSFGTPLVRGMSRCKKRHQSWHCLLPAPCIRPASLEN